VGREKQETGKEKKEKEKTNRYGNYEFVFAPI